jgi:hypothetical protein
MTLEVKHATPATGTDAGDGEIGKVAWNEDHEITLAEGRLVGRSSSGAGAAEEIEIGSGLSLSGGVLAATGGAGGGGAPVVVSAAPAANENDYAPAGFDNTTTLLRLTPTTSVVLTGLAATGFADGQQLTVTNESTDKFIVLASEETAQGTAANRFKLVRGLHRAHKVLIPGERVTLERSGTRWIMVNAFGIDWRVERNGRRHRLQTVFGSYGDLGINHSGAGAGNFNAETHHTNAPYIQRIQGTAYRTTGAPGTIAGNLNKNQPSPGHAKTSQLSRVRFGIDINGGGLNQGSFFAGLHCGNNPSGSSNTVRAMACILGFGTEPGDTQWSLVKNDASGLATKVSLGAGFPVDVADNFNATSIEGLFYYPGGPSTTGIAWCAWRFDDLSVMPAVGYETTDIPTDTNLNSGYVDLMPGYWVSAVASTATYGIKAWGGDMFMNV